jgi:DNA-binding response OmpR family regulator
MDTPFILLVDDEAPFVEAIARRLGKRNIEVLKAFSGEEGLEKLQSNQNLDVVVLDVKMPGMDGIEALKRIKSEYPLVEVIMLTGHATVDTAIGGLKMGAFDYLMKPCDLDELVEKVQKASRRKLAQEEKMREWERFVDGSNLRELMIPIQEYATVSEDANLLEAINALEEAQKAFDPKRYRHRAVLVLDQKKRVVGKVSQHDIIQGLEPHYQQLEKQGQQGLERFGLSDFFVNSVLQEYRLWERPMANLREKATEQRVKHIMSAPMEQEYIDIGASMNEAIHRLIIGRHHSLLVREHGSIVGILRLTDVFHLIHLHLKSMDVAVKIGAKLESEAADRRGDG